LKAAGRLLRAGGRAVGRLQAGPASPDLAVRETDEQGAVLGVLRRPYQDR
jgi:hypothetical protein